MSTLPEQFSHARASQLEAQLAMVRNFTGKAIESVEKIVALNLTTSRAALEKSSAAVNQLIAAKDPRDLLALTTQGQAGFDGILAYGRQLLSIAAELQPGLTVPTPFAAPAAREAAPAPAVEKAPAAAAPQAAAPVPVKAAEVAAVAPAVTPAATPAVAPAVTPAAPKAAAAAEPEVKLAKPKKAVEVAAPAAEAVPEPLAKAKPIAKAAAKVADAPAELPKPAATFPAPTSRLVSVPPVKPVEASPPPAPVSGTPVIDAKQGDLLAVKAPKKK